MKKILSILMLLALLMSCSDDNDEPIDGNGNMTIDYKILGKWKVEYSKTIRGAEVLEDGTIGIMEGAEIMEYDGKLSSNISSSMFNSSERAIGITDNNIIRIYWFNSNGGLTDAQKDVHYKIEESLLKWITPIGDIFDHKYSHNGEELIIERMPNQKNKWEYTISKYSKIKE